MSEPEKKPMKEFSGDVPASMPTYRLSRLKSKKTAPPAVSAGGLHLALEGADVFTGVPQVLVDLLPPGLFRITREKGRKK